jgi:hypothetical protein
MTVFSDFASRFVNMTKRTKLDSMNNQIWLKKYIKDAEISLPCES